MSIRQRGPKWYQRRFARWVNNMVAFNSMTWDEWQATFKTKLQANRGYGNGDDTRD